MRRHLRKFIFTCKLVVTVIALMMILNWTKRKTITEPEIPSPEKEMPETTALSFSNISNELSKIRVDDERLIIYILQYHLTPPPTSGNIDQSPSPNLIVARLYEQQEVSRYVMDYFKEKKEGFYIECGANDGVFYSNTLPLETRYNWTGLLIEADPRPFGRLRKRNRKAWLANTCLSTTPHPTKVKMMRNEKAEGLSFVPGYRHIIGEKKDYKEFTAECFPLYSLLLAINVTTVDYFSLDIEGTELDVLKTIPWDKVTIKMFSIEVHPKYADPMREYMTSVGYKYLTFIKNGYSHDQLYALEATSK